MQSIPTSPAQPATLPLEDFGQLQARYQALGLAKRAAAVLKDAEPALETADGILQALAANPNIKKIFSDIRKNALIAGKLRPSDARNMLMDASSDFLEGTRHKLAAWRKTMERISNGEDIVSEKSRDYIPMSSPLALAIAGTSGVSSYLSVVQLVMMELTKKDAKNADSYRQTMSGIRRCATVLGDCEGASGINTSVR